MQYHVELDSGVRQETALQCTGYVISITSVQLERKDFFCSNSNTSSTRESTP